LPNALSFMKANGKVENVPHEGPGRAKYDWALPSAK
jgi:hypothetical protein